MLAGSLTEFTLPDVFALLGSTRKTGVLNLTGADTSGRVWILGGQLAYAVADVNRSQLAARLLHGGEILPEDVAALVHSQAAGNGVQMAAALAGVGVPVDRAAALLHDQVVDAAFDLSRWNGGDFAFDASSYGEVPDSTPTFTADDIMTAVELRLVEWEGIVTKLPSPSSVLRPVSRPVTRDGIIQIQPDQWEVLTLIDGVRTVAEIIRLTGQGQFTVAKLLSGLIDGRLVQLREDSGPLTVTQERATQLALIEHEVLGAPMPHVQAPTVDAAPAAAPVAYADHVEEPVETHHVEEPVETHHVEEPVEEPVADVVEDEPVWVEAQRVEIEQVEVEQVEVEQVEQADDPSSMGEGVALSSDDTAQDDTAQDDTAQDDLAQEAAEQEFDVASLISGMPGGTGGGARDEAPESAEDEGGFSAADELSLESILSGGMPTQTPTDSGPADDRDADVEEMDEDARIRELAALGLSLSAGQQPAPQPVATGAAAPSAGPTDSSDGSDDLLSRLIDGVKGA